MLRRTTFRQRADVSGRECQACVQAHYINYYEFVRYRAGNSKNFIVDSVYDSSMNYLSSILFVI